MAAIASSPVELLGELARRHGGGAPGPAAQLSSGSAVFDALLFKRAELRPRSREDIARALADAAYDLRCGGGGGGAPGAGGRDAAALEALGQRLLQRGEGLEALRCLLELPRREPAAGDGRPAPVATLRVPRGERGRYAHFAASLFAAEPRAARRAKGGGDQGGALDQLVQLLQQPPRFRFGAAGAPASASRAAEGAVPPAAASAVGAAGRDGQQAERQLLRRSVCWETARLRALCAAPTAGADLAQPAGASAPRLASPALHFTREGVDAFDAGCRAHELLPLGRAEAAMVIAESDLMRACSTALQGLKSAAFAFDEQERRFVWSTSPAVRLRSCSGDALANAMRQVAAAGTSCARLEHLSRLLGDEHHSQGLVRRQLGRALGGYVHHVRTWLAISPDEAGAPAPPNLTQLLFRTRGIRQQLAQVCALCGWANDASSPSLPDGMHLLNRLYNAATACGSAPEQRLAPLPAVWSSVVRMLFHEALQPFIWFAEAWLRHGAIDDPFGEFSSSGFADAAALDVDLGLSHSGAPAFLAPRVWNKLRRCGATVGQLRRYEPAHYLLAAAGSAPVLDLRGAVMSGDEEGMERGGAGNWPWLAYHHRQRELWAAVVDAAAEKRRLLNDQKLATQSARGVSDVARAVRAAAAEAAVSKEADAQDTRLRREQYAEDLREQMASDEQRKEDEQATDNEPPASEIFPQVEMVARMIEQEYAAKLAAVELRIARLSWQQRRLDLQGARIRNWRREADLQHQLLQAHSLEASVDPADSEPVADVPAVATVTPADLEQPAELTDGDGVAERPERALLEAEESGSSGAGQKPDGEPDTLSEVDTEPVIEHTVSAAPAGHQDGGEAAEDSDLPRVAEIHHERVAQPAARLSPDAPSESRAPGGWLSGLDNLRSCRPVGSGAEWSSAQPTVPLDVLLKHSLQDTVEQHDQLAQAAAVQMYLHPAEVDLVKHLRALRDFCLTGSPGFASALSGIISEGVRTGTRAWMTQRNCAVALASAFSASGTSDRTSSQFELTISPAAAAQTADDTHDLDVLQSCGARLRYLPAGSWPLELVLDEACMDGYNELWRMLMKVQRVVQVARSLWELLKELSHGRRAPLEQINRLSLIRHDVQQFLNALQDYLMTQVLHVQWSRLERDLQAADEVGGICQLHRDYLDRLLSGCLLHRSSSGPRKVIASMFELVLTFAKQLAAFSRGHRAHASEPVPVRAFPEMTRTGELFRKHTEFLTRSEAQFIFAAPALASRSRTPLLWAGCCGSKFRLRHHLLMRGDGRSCCCDWSGNTHIGAVSAVT